LISDIKDKTMTNQAWLNRNVVGIGEAMVEFAPIGDNVYRRSFAGDTLNTCWHIAQIIQDHGRVGYFTKVGSDAFSEEFINFLTASGIDPVAIRRDATRSIGLYVISLSHAERSFSYWRELSAARRLADDPNELAAAMLDTGLIHITGITLAIIGEEGRRNLKKALCEARSKGAIVSYDPNVRRRLWPDESEMRRALCEILEVTDITLPSFDDEAQLWGDASPEETIGRLAQLGVAEIVVKNGSGEVLFLTDGVVSRVATPAVDNICDTTGAGDSFNAGYLAGRLVGMAPLEACKLGQDLAGEIISHFGALAPQQALVRFRTVVGNHLAKS
jgi:2-dehydro-3-deoxygluconokinase